MDSDITANAVFAIGEYIESFLSSLLFGVTIWRSQPVKTCSFLASTQYFNSVNGPASWLGLLHLFTKCSGTVSKSEPSAHVEVISVSDGNTCKLHDSSWRVLKQAEYGFQSDILGVLLKILPWVKTVEEACVCRWTGITCEKHRWMGLWGVRSQRHVPRVFLQLRRLEQPQDQGWLCTGPSFGEKWTSKNKTNF